MILIIIIVVVEFDVIIIIKVIIIIIIIVVIALLASLTRHLLTTHIDITHPLTHLAFRCRLATRFAFDSVSTITIITSSIVAIAINLYTHSEYESNNTHIEHIITCIRIDVPAARAAVAVAAVRVRGGVRQNAAGRAPVITCATKQRRMASAAR